MDMPMALSNIRVLDLTRVMAGPYCTMYLADLGAEVIKIEIPGSGDDTRKLPPFKNGESLYYCNLNRNKIGVTLNLKDPEGKELFKEMVKNADVAIFSIHDDQVPDSVLARLTKDAKGRTVHAYFISPYLMSKYKESALLADATVVGYESAQCMQYASADVIFGAN